MMNMFMSHFQNLETNWAAAGGRIKASPSRYHELIEFRGCMGYSTSIQMNEKIIVIVNSDGNYFEIFNRWTFSLEKVCLIKFIYMDQ